MKMDLHIHTHFSRTKRWGSASLIEPKQLLDRIVELGLDGLAVTDHDEIEGSLLVAELAPQWGLLAVPGIEISAKGGHILGLGITEMVPKGLSPRETIERIHDLGGIAVAAHPLNIFVSLRLNDVISLPLDALETHNSRSLRNRKSSRLSYRLKIGQTGGSDAHSINEIGTGLTETPNRCKTYQDLITQVVKRHTVGHGRRGRYSRIARECIHTAAKQKREQIRDKVLVSLGIRVA